MKSGEGSSSEESESEHGPVFGITKAEMKLKYKMLQVIAEPIPEKVMVPELPTKPPQMW
jgi:hypothetical protein